MRWINSVNDIEKNYYWSDIEKKKIIGQVGRMVYRNESWKFVKENAWYIAWKMDH